MLQGPDCEDRGAGACACQLFCTAAHAVVAEQVISFRSARLHPDLDQLRHKLNSTMPKDVRFAHIQHVPQDFNARYSAVSKQYVYRLQTGPVLDPLCRGYSQHVPHDLDLIAMRCVSSHLLLH